MREFLAAAVAMLCLPAYAGPPAYVQQIHDQIMAPTVWLGMGCTGQIIYSDEEKRGEGIATYILTARHCIKGDENRVQEVVVQHFDQGRAVISKSVYLGKVDASSYNSDVSVIKLFDRKTKFPNIVRLAPPDTQLYIGEKTWSIGYPITPSVVITEAYLGAQDRFYEEGGDTDLNRLWERASHILAGGNSGGGLWHMSGDGIYEMIGLATAGFRGSPVSMFTSLSDIYDFLKGSKKVVYDAILPPGAGLSGHVKCASPTCRPSISPDAE